MVRATLELTYGLTCVHQVTKEAIVIPSRGSGEDEALACSERNYRQGGSSTASAAGVAGVRWAADGSLGGSWVQPPTAGQAIHPIPVTLIHPHPD